MKKALLLFGLFIMATVGYAHEDILLNDGWGYRPVSDPGQGVKNIPVTLPHTWNANYVTEINALYKQADPSRLTTFATCVDHTYYKNCSDLMAWNKCNFYFKDMTVGQCPKLVSARGLPERPITDVTFENVQSANKTMTMIDTDNWTFK